MAGRPRNWPDDRTWNWTLPRCRLLRSVEGMATTTKLSGASRSAHRGTGSGCPPNRMLARAADEFALTAVLLFLAVTVVRWLRDPGSALYIADFNVALVVI